MSLFRRFLSALTALMILAGVNLAFASTASAQESAPSPTAPVAVPTFNGTDVDAALVYLDFYWSGTSTVTLSDGTSYQRPAEAHTTGSGWFIEDVDPDPNVAYIASAGHCVDPAEGSQIVNQQMEGRTGFSNKNGYDPSSSPTSSSTGKGSVNSAKQAPVTTTSISPAQDLTVTVIASQPQLQLADRAIAGRLTVTVMDFQRFVEGDNALLKLRNPDKTPQTVRIASESPKVHDEVTTVGFSAAQVYASIQGPQSSLSSSNPAENSRVSVEHNDGSVSNLPIDHGVVRTKVNQGATIYPGMSGGPLLNTKGEALGVNGASLNDPYAPSFSTVNAGYVASDLHDLRALLVKNGVISSTQDTANAASISKLSDETKANTDKINDQWWLLPLLLLILLGLMVITILLFISNRNNAANNPNRVTLRQSYANRPRPTHGLFHRHHADTSDPREFNDSRRQQDRTT